MNPGITYDPRDWQANERAIRWARSTPFVKGRNQIGNAVVTSGWVKNSGVLRRGDIITLGLHAVTIGNRVHADSLRQFVVTDDVVSDAKGDAVIPITPPINPNPRSPYRTVDKSPPHGGAVTPQAYWECDSSESEKQILSINRYL